MDLKMNDGQDGCYVKVNDLTVYYEKSGVGIPLILLHGGGLTSQIWRPHRTFLSKNFQVFAPDCRGHGRTDNPLGTLSYRGLADDLIGFINELNLSKPLICGWSMGASISLEFGMLYPKEAKALICCGGGPALTELEIQEIIHDEEKLLLASKTEEVMRSKHSHVYGETYWKTLVKNLHQLLVEGYSEENYSQIFVPTLIMCGDHEERPGVEAYVGLFRKIPDSELAVIPNADHFSPTTSVELFTSLITEFLLRHSV